MASKREVMVLHGRVSQPSPHPLLWVAASLYGQELKRAQHCDITWQECSLTWGLKGFCYSSSPEISLLGDLLGGLRLPVGLADLRALAQLTQLCGSVFLCAGTPGDLHWFLQEFVPNLVALRLVQFGLSEVVLQTVCHGCCPSLLTQVWCGGTMTWSRQGLHK